MCPRCVIVSRPKSPPTEFCSPPSHPSSSVPVALTRSRVVSRCQKRVLGAVLIERPLVLRRSGGGGRRATGSRSLGLSGRRSRGHLRRCSPLMLGPARLARSNLIPAGGQYDVSRADDRARPRLVTYSTGRPLSRRISRPFRRGFGRISGRARKPHNS